jgi:exodeoxyribonuclease X
MIVVFDTETTGLIEPEVVQAAYLEYSSSMSNNREKLFGVSKPIEWVAMGLHGITNEKVKGKRKWDGNFIPVGTKYLVAHNASFDTQFLPKETIDNIKIVCTLKLAKKLIPKHECGDHKNSTLYYYLGCYKNPIGKEYLGKTHTALSDCAMTLNVLVGILNKYNLTIEQAYEMMSSTEENKTHQEDVNVCLFKKHIGELWVDVVQKDREYCKWLLDGGKIKNPAMEKLVRSLM